MSRITIIALACFTIGGWAQASDLEKYQPGAKPFHTPKSPQPVGVLTNCFGYHATNWTPWNLACSETNCPPASVPQPVSTKTIILYDRAPEAAPAPSKIQPMPTPVPK